MEMEKKERKRVVAKIKMQNQAFMLLPLLFFMLIDNWFPYDRAFLYTVIFSITVLAIYWFAYQDKMYYMFFLPATIVLALYAVFLLFGFQSLLYYYSPAFLEMLFVIVATAILGMRRRSINRIRKSTVSSIVKNMKMNNAREFFRVEQIIIALFTFHIFLMFFFKIIPQEGIGYKTNTFLYRYLPVLLCVLVIVYEQIRMWLMRKSLHNEEWLPILDDKGSVIGNVARSVSSVNPGRYRHPAIRVVLLYKGMLYLVKRPKDDYSSPDTLDFPLRGVIGFRKNVNMVLEELLAPFGGREKLKPRYLMRYNFENKRVKQTISLFVLTIRSEELLGEFQALGGKLWTEKQIEENLGKGVFSDYLEQEFPYLQNTILLAERICAE